MELRCLGITFDLDRTARRPVLAFSRALPVQLIGDTVELTPWLLAVALGRYTGHALAVCDACGALSMLSVVTASGATYGEAGPRGGKPAPWPTCLLSPPCTGRRRISVADLDGIERRKAPAIGRPPQPPRPAGLPWPTDAAYRGD
jgi:hypothetical protein